MRDRILSTYVKDFVDTFSLAELDEAKAFEHLASYCVVSKYNPENFEPGDVAVGGSGDLGLDGVGILVNDHLETISKPPISDTTARFSGFPLSRE